MKKTRYLIPLLAGILLFSCERPSSPDFEVQQTFEIPLIKSTSYRFLGEGDGVIIDTTSSNFEDLFVVGGDGLITLSTEIDFEIGEFDDIIPAIDVDPTEVDTEIGLLEVDDFSTEFESEIGEIEADPETFDPEQAEVGVFEVEFEGSGSADFETVTGLPAATAPAGTPIPAPDDPVVVTIELDAEDFQRAEINQGGIRFVFENNLGFNISDLDAVLLVSYDSNTETGIQAGTALDFGAVAHGESETDVIVFDPGEEIIVDMAIQVTIDWNAQNMVTDAGDLEVTSSDENLEVRNATANISSQILRPSLEDLVIDNENFEYAIVYDSADELYQLELSITNGTELEITDSLLAGLPMITIVNSDGDILDEPKRFENITSPGANSLGQNETGVVLFTLNGQKFTRTLSYELSIGTPGGTALTVDQDDFFLIESSTTNMKFGEARADIDPQTGIELEDVEEVKGDFVNAEVETGELRLQIINQSNIPMEIDFLRFYNDVSFRAKNTGTFFAQGSDIGELQNVVIPANGSTTEIVNLDGVGISNRIGYEGTASSPGTPEAVTIFATDVIAISLEGSVQVRSASSVLDPQDFSTSGEVEIAEDDFVLASMDHYVEIQSGTLRISGIVNEIDLGLDTLIISFPTIRTNPTGTGDYGPADSLWFEFTGANRIRRGADNQNLQPAVEQSLENVRIYAPGNKLTYNVVAITENTRLTPDSVRTVNSTDRFVASVGIDDLSIKTAFGVPQTRVELLNDDVGDDGIIDLFNDDEAELTEIEDLAELSERISGLRLANPGFDLIYDSNLGVKGVIIAAILGVNDKGEEVFLSGKPGSALEVADSDDYLNLFARGIQIDRSDLIKFELEPVTTIGEVGRNRVIRFDTLTSNVADFLSNLPTEIRFIGKVIANPDGDEGFIVDPIEFSTNMGIDIPINLSTEEGSPASIEDTLKADLSDLPNPDDDLQLSEMVLFIKYENGLPFSTGFEMQFLDENEQPITTLAGTPIDGVGFRIDGALIDPVSRFVSQARSGMTEIRVSGEQLEYLYKTRKIKLLGELATSRDDLSGEVKVRADDYISLGVSARFTTSVRVN